MFIKIVHYPEESPDPQIHERMIECKDYLFSYFPGGERVRIETLTNNHTVDRIVELDCDKSLVYIMSDRGQTIDSYKWRGVDGVIKRV